jgi:hypothetical protein
MKLYQGTKGLIVLGAFLLAGCDQATQAMHRITHISKNLGQQGTTRSATEGATIGNAEKKGKIEIFLECPIGDTFLDGSPALKGSVEKIYLKKEFLDSVSVNDSKSGWGPVSSVDAKITSAGKVYDLSLVETDGLYAVLAYADRKKDGISSNVRSTTYVIDLTNNKFGRSVHSFPYGSTNSFRGQCKLIPISRK